MNTSKRLSLIGLSSLMSLSVLACPDPCPSEIEGDQLESTAITLLEYSKERTWRVLNKGLESYEVLCENEDDGRILIECGPGSQNHVLLWTEAPRVDDGVLPRSMVHLLSSCAPDENVKLLDLQNDILDAALTLPMNDP